MSEVTERLQAYHDSGTTDGWPGLRAWLISYDFTPQDRYEDPQPGPLDERDWDHPFIDGSWDELDRARGRLITDAEYRQVADGRKAAAGASASP